MLTLAALVISLHFGRTLAGNVYRACPAFFASRANIAQAIGKTKVVPKIQEDGSVKNYEVADEDAITRRERCRFFAHLLLAS